MLVPLLALPFAAEAPAGCWVPDPPSPPPERRSLPPHPRLRVSDARLAELNDTIRTHRTAAAYFEGMKQSGTALLSVPPVDCGPGADILHAARQTLGLQYTLGL